MTTAENTILREMFKLWCARNGYKPVRTVDSLSAVGEAALYRRSGRYSVEVATELDPVRDCRMVEAGFQHGYGYPLLDANGAKAQAFFGVR